MPVDRERVLNSRARAFFEKEVIRVFFDKADEDYVSSRILFLHNIHSSFLWMAQQTLEKYLKCALLLRGRKIKQDHDLKWHLKQLKTEEDISFPITLDAPLSMPRLPEQSDDTGRTRPWPFREELTQVVSKISEMGGSASRYNRTDHDVDPYDLVKFDLVVKLFRDAAKETREIQTCRDNENARSPSGRHTFGRLKLSDPAFNLLKQSNYAYWPKLQHGDLPATISFRNNSGPRAIFKHDVDYYSALKKIDELAIKRNQNA